MSFPKWLTYGTGIGIEILAGGNTLRIVAAKVRPAGVSVLSTLVIERIDERQAVDWGAEFSTFLKRLGSSHLSATVILPRSEVTVRQLMLPGVKDEDLASAISYQIDSLHPYPEDEVICDWARAGKSPFVVVGIARREVIERYSNLFAEAGIQVKSFTSTAPAFHTALRLYEQKPPQDFLALRDLGDGQFEAYGEGPANSAFSNVFDAPSEPIARRLIGLALAELRLPPETEPLSFERALPVPVEIDAEIPLADFAVAYAAALHSAVIRNGLNINLLPPEKRKKDSKLIYIPTAVLGTVLVALCLMLVFYDKIEEQRYLLSMQDEMAKVRPDAVKADNLDQQAANARVRIDLLDKYRQRAPQDLDVLNELTRVLAPPVWVNSFDMGRTTVMVSGEADQATPLLKALDESPLFANSDFTMPLGRTGQGELFRIRMEREFKKQ
jgi:Tfp pilus assembly protein PilN